MGEQRLFERVKKPEDYSVAKAKQAVGKYPRLDKWKKEFYQGKILHCIVLHILPIYLVAAFQWTVKVREAR